MSIKNSRSSSQIGLEAALPQPNGKRFIFRSKYQPKRHFKRFPPDTDEKQKKLGEWFGNNDPHGVAAALPEYMKALQAANPSIKSWGILGVS